MHGELHKKRHIEFPFLVLGADPSLCLFVCSLSSTLSVVICASVMKCVMPLVENGKTPLDESLVMSSLV